MLFTDLLGGGKLCPGAEEGGRNSSLIGRKGDKKNNPNKKEKKKKRKKKTLDGLLFALSAAEAFNRIALKS
ncbi:hypothetical protein AAES_163667 [Amazona aestiva]|uniref:Uncharacterized protein n=1 Tax=Amazona aestiva TaxID=12930 RepID=A0A0Q3LTR7_AMAAE|nr:hypothetical protein AAES_163667 [Amazona aestiva]